MHDNDNFVLKCIRWELGHETECVVHGYAWRTPFFQKQVRSRNNIIFLYSYIIREMDRLIGSLHIVVILLLWNAPFTGTTETLGKDIMNTTLNHDDVIKWKHFPRYWTFVRGILITGEFPSQRPVTRSFAVFFDLRLNKLLSKQSIRQRLNAITLIMTSLQSTYPHPDQRRLQGLLGPLRWRHNGCDSVSNHQPHHCLLNRLFRRRSKKTSKLRVTGLCAGNSPGTG